MGSPPKAPPTQGIPLMIANKRRISGGMLESMARACTVSYLDTTDVEHRVEVMRLRNACDELAGMPPRVPRVIVMPSPTRSAKRTRGIPSAA